MGYASPHQPLFNNIFDEYNFSILLNLFDNNPYTCKHKSKCANKMRHWVMFGEGLKIRGKT